MLPYLDHIDIIDKIKIFTGIFILTGALFMTAGMGIYQEKIYAQYGKHPKESLFFNVGLFTRITGVLSVF